MGGHLVQQEIPGPGVKQERDGHVDHQEAPENPKWEVWLDATPDVVVPVRVPGATGSKGGDPTCQEAWGLVPGGGGMLAGQPRAICRGKREQNGSAPAEASLAEAALLPAPGTCIISAACSLAPSK